MTINIDMDLSIIIVSWNVKTLLQKCLDSISQNQGSLNLEIFVADNNSTDGTTEMVQAQYPEIKLMANKYNKGFAAANNQAIKLAKGKYILLLNPDTEILHNTLETMMSFMDQHEDVGISGCQILNPDKTIQPSVRNFPTKKAIWLLFTKLAKFQPNHPALKKYFAVDFDYQVAQPVDQVMGAFFLIRKKVIDQIGILDEKFFIWFEEVDYCKRAKDAGWEIWYTPIAKIIHHGGRSFKQATTVKKQLLFFKSAKYYLKKHNA